MNTPPAEQPVSHRNGPVEHLSAVTLATPDMAAAVPFYEALGFERRYGGPDADFTSFCIGAGFLNLQHADARPRGAWGRVIFWVDDVDAMHERALAAGFSPSTDPADAPWGERYFHLRDPSGHELSFARPSMRDRDGELGATLRARDQR